MRCLRSAYILHHRSDLASRSFTPSHWSPSAYSVARIRSPSHVTFVVSFCGIRTKIRHQIGEGLSRLRWFGARSCPVAASAFGGLATGYFPAGIQGAIPHPVFRLPRASRDADVNIEVDSETDLLGWRDPLASVASVQRRCIGICDLRVYPKDGAPAPCMAQTTRQPRFSRLRACYERLQLWRQAREALRPNRASRQNPTI